MSSYPRNLQRRAVRALPDYEPSTRPHVDLPDGGYAVLHPTKGWRAVSARRITAQGRMAQILWGEKA
ncbi:MAG: hypothetical protein GOVbin7759_39 [Prokaryotic dsDNA virus sp.]|jgi:hypothetical protein|nr:MAG: hypothetical protein GOVbin7759_39 [Prokaryotic dsDNA virus sp.]|tara:strand:+ start:17484 stop:17684 length:201 start_codon:yes stop_codon:yes gene_type:complete